MIESNRKLTHKQQRFVDAFEGNATEAARLAGYKGTDNSLGVMGNKLLRNGKILQAILNRHKKSSNKLVKSRQARLEWLAELVLDAERPMSERLSAMDKLCRASGDYIVKHQVMGGDGETKQFPPITFILAPVPEELKGGSISKELAA